MPSLYSLRSTPDGAFAITKFSQDLHPESLYALSPSACTCPQGHKSTCRHRKMLPIFLTAKHVDDGWFLEWETRRWVPAITEDDAVALEAAELAAGDVIEGDPASYTLPPSEGEGPEPSTHAADSATSPSASGRGQPSPMKRRKL